MAQIMTLKLKLTNRLVDTIEEEEQQQEKRSAYF
jgi:hypothetical protein